MAVKSKEDAIKALKICSLGDKKHEFKKTEREFSVTCIRDESNTDYPSCFL